MTDGLTLSVVAVTDDALQETLLDALLDDRSPYDAVFMESVARGYSRIRQIVPELIIVLTRIDDAETCRLLTMLALDRELCSIPVVTWVAPDAAAPTVEALRAERSAGLGELVHM
jgi:PleD family two-component response regulator